jgi:amino acid transporter
MAFLIIFVLAFVLDFVLRRKGRRKWVSIAAPVVCSVLFVLFDAYVLPYRGGGASMWPIAVLFGAPVAVGGGLLGVVIARRLDKSRQGGDSPF